MREKQVGSLIEQGCCRDLLSQRHPTYFYADTFYVEHLMSSFNEITVPIRSLILLRS